jgi:Mor family transcriptional regulator
MNNEYANLSKLIKVPLRYIPKTLSKKDKVKQKAHLNKSRKLYKKGIYYSRPKVKSFVSKESPHIRKMKKMYNVTNVSLPELAKKTKCSEESLNKIVKKGEGAYFSSGSRPNQTAHSWGFARLASSLTGGNASAIDYKELESGCNPNSRPLILAKKRCKTLGRNCGKTMKKR